MRKKFLQPPAAPAGRAGARLLRASLLVSPHALRAPHHGEDREERERGSVDRFDPHNLGGRRDRNAGDKGGAVATADTTRTREVVSLRTTTTQHKSQARVAVGI